jgi:hypothetical protein
MTTSVLIYLTLRPVVVHVHSGSLTEATTGSKECLVLFCSESSRERHVCWDEDDEPETDMGNRNSGLINDSLPALICR